MVTINEMVQATLIYWQDVHVWMIMILAALIVSLILELKYIFEF